MKLPTLALLFAPLLTLTHPQTVAAAPPSGTIYSDSDGNDTNTLAPLYDGDTASGGIVYQP